MSNTKLLNDDQRLYANAQWKETVPLVDRLPVYFPQGACLSELSGCCTKCHQQIEDDNFRLKLSRPIPEVVTFDGWGHCEECNLLTPFSFRVRGNKFLTLEVFNHEKGWQTFASTSPNRIQQIKNLFKSKKPLLSGIIPQLELIKDSNNLAKNILNSGWANIIDYQLANAGNLNLRVDLYNKTSDNLVFLDRSNNRITISLNLVKDNIWGEVGPFQIMCEQPIVENENIKFSIDI